MASSSDTVMEPKPPDEEPLNSERASFRDTLIGNKNPRPPKEKVHLISNNLFRIELEDGNRLKPRCYPQAHNPGELKDLAANLESTHLNADPASGGNLDQAKDALHGDWLVVTRTRKGKGKPQNKDIKQPGNVKDPGKSSKTPPIQAPPVCQHIGQVPGTSNQMIFQSKAIATASPPRERKKRHRIDPPSQNVVIPGNNSQLQGIKPSKLSESGAKNSSLPQSNPFGFKTTLNVDILSRKRMRFRDDDDPCVVSSSKTAETNSVSHKDQAANVSMVSGSEPPPQANHVPKT
ncbi:hypothetical protein SESBI_27984 [Sesbania bispinosa]|nr:hypothetical protein SESBI_27984 [Sesbania bispinosa]